MTEPDWPALLAFLAASFAAASSGALFRPGAWYEALRKPSWTPPNWAFPVVWSILYVTIALSGWLVWSAAGATAWPALALFAAQLVLNAGWSALFFGARRLDWAMAEVAALWASIAAVIAAFAPHSQAAALLLAPYLAWVTVAAFLNYRLLRLNGARGPVMAQSHAATP
jgi:tryptophan-rich sensory protein